MPLRQPATGSVMLGERYQQVRGFTERLCAPLAVEDYVIQSMADASPARWHLAHTTWFFETFFLLRALQDYRPHHPAFGRLFNSYYNAVGEPFPRSRRGLLSRPTVEEIYAYRRHVDDRVCSALDAAGESLTPELRGIVELGIQHEQQHQELILTDLKHLFWCNPMLPSYQCGVPVPAGELRAERGMREGGGEGPVASVAALAWVDFCDGVRWIGDDGRGFSFDNERPRHRVFVHRFELASRLVTNGEYLAFIEEGGYHRPEFWLSEGWAMVQQEGWRAPLYWQRGDDEWAQFTLGGSRPLDPAEPVCHVSYFEADAFARWAQARLPDEAEWEVASEEACLAGNFVESERFHPACDTGVDGRGRNRSIRQLFGDVWEWTGSAYLAYPGFRPAAGALGEYNGKFMCNQFVLRGGSCATSRSHIRRTYRNFFPAAARWQFTGIRVAR